MVREYRDEYSPFVIVIGSPNKSRTEENPLTATEREAVIRGCFPDVPVVWLEDEDRDEAGYPDWARELVDRTGADVVVTRNDLVQRIVREYTDASVVEQPLYERESFSGTEIRRRIRGGEPWRELVPDCCEAQVADYVDIIRDT